MHFLAVKASSGFTSWLPTASLSVKWVLTAFSPEKSRKRLKDLCLWPQTNVPLKQRVEEEEMLFVQHLTVRVGVREELSLVRRMLKIQILRLNNTFIWCGNHLKSSAVERKRTKKISLSFSFPQPPRARSGRGIGSKRSFSAIGWFP